MELLEQFGTFVPRQLLLIKRLHEQLASACSGAR
jgi:hypothetical protein